MGRDTFMRLVWAVPRSLAATKGMDQVWSFKLAAACAAVKLEAKNLTFFSFPPGTEMFHFPGFPTIRYVFTYRQRGIPRAGFPHSDIPGSKVAWDLPEA